MNDNCLTLSMSDDFFKEKVLNFIYTEYLKSGKSEVVIVNIGSDKISGDVFGPLLGTKLFELGVELPVYGNLNFPIHALNLEHYKNMLNLAHSEAFIIATDACLGTREEINKVKLRNSPLNPGLGVGKTLPKIGDISILFMSTISQGIDMFIRDHSVRIANVYNCAALMARSIKEFEELYLKK